MVSRTCRVGLHGRNNVTFEDIDYQVIQTAKIEALKMMGQTKVAVFKRLKQENPTIELITRLYDDRFGVDKHPSPEEFANKQIPIIKALKRYCTKFEVHNEPNHLHRYEGWGQEDHYAQDFNDWFLKVYNLIKKACPWALLGFPGLAIPHRDLEWIEICRPAVEQADWLGVHCYWQTPPGQERNHLADFWGLRFKYYYEKFPNKIQEITECGNSNIQANPPIQISEDNLARQYQEYYQELFKYPYLNSAAFFMLSSQDPTWDFFSWRSENGRVKAVVQAVGQMDRPELTSPQTTISTTTFTPGNNANASPDLKFILAGVPIKDIVATLPKSTTTTYPERPLTDIKQIIIHHSAISEKVGPERIAKIQVQQGRAGISYHYFIDEAGQIYQTNYLTTVSNHTANHSQNSIAICFAGNFTNLIPTQAQLKAGAALSAALSKKLTISLSNLKGASELIATQSPGKQWLTAKAWKNLLLNQINQPQDISSIGTPPVVTPPPTTESGVSVETDIETSNKITALNSQISQLSAQLAQVNSEKAAANAQINALNNQIAQLEIELAQAKQGTTLTTNTTDVIALQNKIIDLELQLSLMQETAVSVSSTPSISAPPHLTIASPTIKNMVNQLTQHASNRYPSRSIQDIKTIIIHHTAVPATISAERIAQFHVNKNNWPGIGFHYIITETGLIEQSNELSTVSYHAGNKNQSSIGIAFAGNFDNTIPNTAQLNAGGHLIAWLMSQFNLSLNAIEAHKDSANTPCPGQQWDSGQNWQKMLITAVKNNLSDAKSINTTGGKTLYHYLLFWQNNTNWAKDDFLGATNYISKFYPSIGFSVQEAMQAQYVTIIGSPLGISAQDEARLQANGCQVERLAGNTPQATKALLDNLAATNRRFLRLTGN